MAPEFFSLLMEVTPLDRTGEVFHLIATKYKSPRRLNYYAVRETVGKIGKEAKVKTSEAKFASAHDLRRSFGGRWSKRVMPPILQKLMRHGSIQTTMVFCAVEDAIQTADAVWRSLPNTLLNRDSEPTSSNEQASNVNSDTFEA